MELVTLMLYGLSNYWEEGVEGEALWPFNCRCLLLLILNKYLHTVSCVGNLAFFFLKEGTQII